MIRLASIATILVLTLGPSVEASGSADVATSDALALYDRTIAVVKEHFHDRRLVGQPFDEIAATGRRGLVANGPTRSSFKNIVDGVLATLAPTTPVLTTEDDQLYWTLRNAASRTLAGAPVRQIGAWFEPRGKRWFVSEVFLGTPAAAAGLMRGDEIISIDGKPFAPVRPFRYASAGTKLALEVRRTPLAEPRTIAVGTIDESFYVTMERSMRRGFRIMKVGNKSIAYLPLPAAAHAELGATFLELAGKAAAHADAMVLDLRGNYGAIDMSYAEAICSTASQPAIFTKPVAILVDRQTSSGKERLAWLAQRQKRALIVGEKSPGAWRPGRIVDLTPAAGLLYLAGTTDANAKQSSELVDGTGVSPDVPVANKLMYAAGDDESLTVALAALANRIR